MSGGAKDIDKEKDRVMEKERQRGEKESEIQRGRR